MSAEFKGTVARGFALRRDLTEQERAALLAGDEEAWGRLEAESAAEVENDRLAALTSGRLRVGMRVRHRMLPTLGVGVVAAPSGRDREFVAQEYPGVVLIMWPEAGSGAGGGFYETAAIEPVA